MAVVIVLETDRCLAVEAVVVEIAVIGFGLRISTAPDIVFDERVAAGAELEEKIAAGIELEEIVAAGIELEELVAADTGVEQTAAMLSSSEWIDGLVVLAVPGRSFDPDIAASIQLARDSSDVANRSTAADLAAGTAPAIAAPVGSTPADIEAVWEEVRSENSRSHVLAAWE